MAESKFICDSTDDFIKLRQPVFSHLEIEAQIEGICLPATGPYLIAHFVLL